VWHIACHEVTTFIYFFAFPASIVWSFIGLAQHDIGGCGDAERAIRLTAVLALLYLLLHLFVALTSCCWETMRSRSRGGPQTPSSATAGLVQPEAGAGPSAGGKLLQHMFVPGFESHGAMRQCCTGTCLLPRLLQTLVSVPLSGPRAKH
jgi:hypothetical protein